MPAFLNLASGPKCFIAVEGPTGVGKTITAELLANRLAEVSGAGVHLTSEPTRTPLGQLLNRQEGNLPPRTLALASAGDRYAHVEHEVIPRLDDGLHVVTDRYLQTSLVRQCLNGLPLGEVWSYNRYVLPAITFSLEEEPAVIRDRLAARQPTHVRTESCGPEREIMLYRDAARFLRRQEWQQHTVRTHGHTPDQVVDTILRLLVPIVAA